MDQQVNIVTYELGHALGLADINEVDAINTGIFSVMVNRIVPQSNRFNPYPTQFDKVNLDVLY